MLGAQGREGGGFVQIESPGIEAGLNFPDSNFLNPKKQTNLIQISLFNFNFHREIQTDAHLFFSSFR